MHTIIFEGLGLVFNINPVALTLFGMKIYWYGIIISGAFLMGFLVLMYYAKKFNYNQDDILDLVLIGAPSAIIGARIYYVVFKFDDYRNNIIEVFKIWHGGLAIYGGILGTLFAVIIYCRIKKINIWPILDMAAPGFIIAQAIGRWGNFVNQEAYGRETNLPWAMIINENGIIKSVHPTFLYESLWNLMVFSLLILFYRKYKRIDGEVFLIYIGLYSLGRLWIEGLRTDSLYLGFFRISQILAIVFIVFSVLLFFARRRKMVFANKSEKTMGNVKKNIF